MTEEQIAYQEWLDELIAKHEVQNEAVINKE